MDNPQELDPRYDKYKQECCKCGYQFTQKPVVQLEEWYTEASITCPKCFYEDYWLAI